MRTVVPIVFLIFFNLNQQNCCAETITNQCKNWENGEHLFLCFNEFFISVNSSGWSVDRDMFVNRPRPFQDVRWYFLSFSRKVSAILSWSSRSDLYDRYSFHFSSCEYKLAGADTWQVNLIFENCGSLLSCSKVIHELLIHVYFGKYP